MSHALTDDQVMIRDAAQAFLADASPSAAVRKAMASEAGYDPQVWKRIATELGWCATPIAEEHGGLGLGPVEMALLLEQMGRHLLCAPFFSTVCLAANLLAQAGSAQARGRYLPQIAAGALRATAPLPDDVDWTAAAAQLRARQDEQGWRLDGKVPRVPDGGTADKLLLFARIEDGSVALFAVAHGAKGLAAKPLDTWDATRRLADLALDGVRAELRVDAPVRNGGLARAAALARLYIAAEQLGGAQQCLDLTVAYVSGRKQFGRTIASFQAVKHRCAEMMVRVEALRSAVYGSAFAAAQAAPDEELELDCAAARALAGETYFFCAQEAIQLHGGVGFTWEYDPQLYFKRAQASSHWLGAGDALFARIAQAVA